MSKEQYGWWSDPKNQKTVEAISWWNHPENKKYFNFPISTIESDGIWTATCNDETEKILGKKIHACSQGDTEEKAIERMLQLIKHQHEGLVEKELSYQRWVPFRLGNWKYTGGTWFVVFGIHVYFRYGKNMKGGKYLPLTRLNISIYSEWKLYKNYLNKKKNENNLSSL